MAEVLVWAEGSEALSAPTTDQAHADSTPSLEWLHNFVNRHGLIVQRREPWNGGWRRILNECPFNPEHRGTSAALFVTVNGGFGFKCQHNGCAGKTWHDLRQKFEPASSATYSKHGDQSRSQTNNEGSDPASKINIDEIPPVHSFNSTGIEFVVEGLIARGAITMLAGEPGHGKSTVATVFGYCISKGIDFAGHKCLQRQVLILDRENGIDVIKERFARLGIQDESGLLVWGAWLEYEAPSPAAGVMLDWVSRTDPKPVIIVDSAIAFLERDENSATAVRIFMSQLRQLANLGAAVILLHHSGKAETSKDYRGSSDFKGSIDVGSTFEITGRGSSVSFG